MNASLLVRAILLAPLRRGGVGEAPFASGQCSIGVRFPVVGNEHVEPRWQSAARSGCRRLPFGQVIRMRFCTLQSNRGVGMLRFRRGHGDEKTGEGKCQERKGERCLATYSRFDRFFTS